MTDDAARFFVLTGGPGAGKSTLIDALAAAGFACSAEAGRAVIRAEVAAGGRALPGIDPLAFAERMLERDMRSYAEAREQAGPAFFDRGIPDVVGYLRLTGLPVPLPIETAAATFRYNRRVLVAPPWPDIFRQDRERKQDFDEAVRTHDMMVATYTGYGYDLIELPRAPVAERLRFVLAAAGIAGLSGQPPTSLPTTFAV